MAMSKKDYVAIAAEIAKARDIARGTPSGMAVGVALDQVAHGVAQYAADQNPRFDFARFLRAAGVLCPAVAPHR